MGTFWGHIDEGIFFNIISVWWTFHACRQYLKAQQDGREVKPRLSYSVYCKREIPAEIIFKFTFALMGFFAEFFAVGVELLDHHGNFRKMAGAQHMPIYFISVLHSIIDFLCWARVPMVPEASRVSAALSFGWYGIAFYYHSQMHGKEPLESIVHVIFVGIMLVTAGSMLLESRWQSGVWTLLTRAYCVLTIGTWFSHMAFMLYEHDKFLGEGSSGWDRSDVRNVQYARACFGLHLLFNMIFMLLCYLLTYCAMRWRQEIKPFVTHDDQSDDVIMLSNGNGKVKRDRDDVILFLKDSA